MLLDFVAIFKLTDRNLLCIKGEGKWNQIDCISGRPGFCVRCFFCEKSFGLWVRSLDVVSGAWLWWGFVNLIHLTRLCLALAWNTGYGIRSQVCPELLPSMSCWALLWCNIVQNKFEAGGEVNQMQQLFCTGEESWDEERERHGAGFCLDLSKKDLTTNVLIGQLLYKTE